MARAVEREGFDHLRGQNFNPDAGIPHLGKNIKKILQEYQESLLKFATHNSMPIAEASLPFVLAQRLHTQRETYQSIGTSLGIHGETIRKVYTYYQIPPIPRGERAAEVWKKRGMTQKMSEGARERAKDPEEVKRRSECGRKEMDRRWEDPTGVKRSFAATKYFKLLEEQGHQTAVQVILSVAEDMRRRGLILPVEFFAVLNKQDKGNKGEDEKLDCGVFSYQPSQLQVEIVESARTRTVILRESQAVVFELLARNFELPVPNVIFLPAIGAQDRIKGLGRLRMIVHRLREELKDPNKLGVDLGEWIHTIKDQGYLLMDPQKYLP